MATLRSLAAPRHQLAQENPTYNGSKTPGPSTFNKGPVTGSKGLGVMPAAGKSVLGAKDGNASKNGGRAGPSDAPIKKPELQPRPSWTLNPASLRTPSPSAQRHSQKSISTVLSPDPVLSSPEQEPQQSDDIRLDKEVEYAGPSAEHAYENEPFESELVLPAPGWGKKINSIALNRPMLDLDAWRAEDEQDRVEQVRHGIDIVSDAGIEERYSKATSEAEGPIFPRPPAAVTKPATLPSGGRPTIATSRSRITTSSASTSTMSSRVRPAPASSTIAARRPLASTASSTAPSRKDPSAASRSSAAPTPLPSRKPAGLNGSSARVPLTASTTASRNRVPGTSFSDLTQQKRALPKTNSSIASSAASSLSGRVSAKEKDKRAVNEQERELGIFGVVQDEDDLDLDFGSLILEGGEQDFRFEL